MHTRTCTSTVQVRLFLKFGNKGSKIREVNESHTEILISPKKKCKARNILWHVSFFHTCAVRTQMTTGLYVADLPEASFQFPLYYLSLPVQRTEHAVVHHHSVLSQLRLDFMHCQDNMSRGEKKREIIYKKTINYLQKNNVAVCDNFSNYEESASHS